MKHETVTRRAGGKGVTKRQRMNPTQKGPGDLGPDEYTDLVGAAAAGDPEALDRLLMRAQEIAWRFSTSVCGHADDAEDAMQEALIKTYRYVGQIRDPGAFRPWLYRTVRNACLMGRRKRVASWEKSGTVGGQCRTPSSSQAGAIDTARSVPRDRVPARDRRSVDPGSRDGHGHVRKQRQDATASSSRSTADRPG
jgi:RNA polymerase sigma factor (sigma-70 family)